MGRLGGPLGRVTGSIGFSAAVDRRRLSWQLRRVGAPATENPKEPAFRFHNCYMPIEYRSSPVGLESGDVAGFFVGWPNPPSEETFLKLLAASSQVVLALESGRLIGFITANTDEVLSAYIPFLEVLPSHQGRGVGKELVRRMLDSLRDYYMIDLCCDPELVPFYERFGMTKGTAMLTRNYDRQAG